MSVEPTERDVEALARKYAEGQLCYRVTNPAAFRNDLTKAFMAGVSATTDAERIAEGAAEAWDEGFQAACDETPMGYAPDGPNGDSGNPYRRG